MGKISTIYLEKDARVADFFQGLLKDRERLENSWLFIHHDITYLMYKQFGGECHVDESNAITLYPDRENGKISVSIQDIGESHYNWNFIVGFSYFPDHFVYKCPSYIPAEIIFVMLKK